MALVSAAGDDDQRRIALESLYRAYSTPVYAFIRRRGYGRQDAQDLTQDFFLHLVDRNVFSRADPNRGKFRKFLLGSLEYFLMNAYDRARSEKRGGRAKMIFLDDESAEGTYQLTDPGQTAAQIFDGRWMAALIESTLSRLRMEMMKLGKGELYNRSRVLFWMANQFLIFGDIAKDGPHDLGGQGGYSPVTHPLSRTSPHRSRADGDQRDRLR